MATHNKKYDEGKLPASLLLEFPHALKAVAAVGAYGLEKYQERGSWKKVTDGQQRYTEAEWRHRLDGAITENDAESGLPHRWHEVWNVLAVLELELAAAAGHNIPTLTTRAPKFDKAKPDEELLDLPAFLRPNPDAS
jgi:hypothetical protein